jgi:hypothetical protein
VDAVEVIDVDAYFACRACSRFIDIEAEAGDSDSEDSSEGDGVIDHGMSNVQILKFQCIHAL